MVDYVNSIKNKIINCPPGKSFKNIFDKNEINFINDFTKNINNISFTTRIFYTINSLPLNVKCYKCGNDVLKNINPIIYTKNKIKKLNQNTNTYLCENCNKDHTCNQSYKTRYLRFANREKDLFLKNRILEVGENFYNDEFINSWAVKFKADIGRRPTKEDFKQYFGRVFPRKKLNRNFNKALFDLWDSWLELTVCDYLKTLGYEEKYVKDLCVEDTHFVRNSMFNNKGNWYQIDIYFPTLKLGFEIQDFETHDKYSDEVHYRQCPNSFKHGPTYHNQKKLAALENNITIIELWEDKIRNQSYKEEINLCLNQLI